MYTEDDEKVKVKETNSKNDYNDFYTSFNVMNEEDNNNNKKNSKKKKNEKSKKQESSILKDESDYANFYNDVDDDDEISEHEYNDDEYNPKKKIIKYGIIILLVIVLIVLIILLLKNKIGNQTKNEIGDIELRSSNISLNVGSSDFISYKIVNTESNVSSSFASSNTNVATVDENGKIIAVGPGETTITIYYTIDDVKREKKCTVKVIGPTPVPATPTPVPVTPTPTPIVNEELILNLKIIQGKENSWINQNAVIGVETKTEIGVASLKYATNCSGTCNYVDVKDNKITISNNGTTKVTVKVTDKKNKEVIKEMTVKIDKEAPSVTLNSDKNITSNKNVEVCATCKDNVSGCKQTKVCKKYTSSKSNQTITVTDNAGNTKKSSSFNVTINKMSEPCTLKVSGDGTVTATLRETAQYYGFNSSYSGTNELSKKFDISVSPTEKAGVTAGAKVVHYYVLNKNGTGGTCVITVVKECTCNDGTTKANCKSTCTFRAN